MAISKISVHDVGDDIARLTAAADQEFLALLSWDPEVAVLVFPQSHPLLGWTACQVTGCSQRAFRNRSGLCPGCAGRWRRDGKTSLEDFLLVVKPVGLSRGDAGRCAVKGCPRPWCTARSRLCNAHNSQRKYRGLSFESYLMCSDLTSYPSFGPCAVTSCTRDRPGKKSYCPPHQIRYVKAVKLNPSLDRELWNRTAPSIADNNEVSLRGLHSRVIAELLYGIQERTHGGAKTRYRLVRQLCDALRSERATSVQDLVEHDELSRLLVNRDSRALLGTIARQAHRLGLTPETERRKDVWDLAVFGQPGKLKFTEISQSWLREGAKRWAVDDIPRRRGPNVGDAIKFKMQSIELLSDSLRLQRQDKGDVLTTLGHQDLTAFCNRMAYLQGQGTISAYMCSKHMRNLRQVLTRMRTMGLTRTSEPLYGLPDDFAVIRDYLPDRPEDAEVGKDLPVDVMRHLCANLPNLEETTSPQTRAAVELLIDTGRRPGEICNLRFDCLRQDSDGNTVLIYSNDKSYRQDQELPVGPATAAVILAQQERVRAQFPDTALAELRLLPSSHMNPGGRKSMGQDRLGTRHRDWVATLPDVGLPCVVEIDGTLVTKIQPFDKSRAFLYAYRHTYAQRHADAGVDVTVLKELMGHRLLSTTQSYYRVGQERRRETVERVTTMQFDRHGDRVWRQATAMLDSERLRRAVGEVAVPYGGCSEPSNVAAGGQDCPLRFRCIGCGHFSTDISYLPDLERYVADLLRHRERVLASVDADQWAKSEAMPSDHEITRVRRLIDRMKGDLDNLTREERAQIEEATTLVRHGRANVVGLGVPRVRQPRPDIRQDSSA
jgi:integrase